MTKILVPVDLANEQSWERVLPEALLEARLRNAELHLLAVVPDVGSVLTADRLPRGFDRQVMDQARERLAEMKEKNIPADVPTVAHVARGHAAEEILRCADRLGVDLIVMCSHRPDMLRTLLVGSVADKIVHNAKQSVLVVRS